MKILLMILLACVSSFGQLDYSPKPQHKDSAAKMHFAIKLFRGVTPVQEGFLLRAIRDKRSVSETEAYQLFTSPEVRDVFFGIGREDVTDYKRIYEKGKLAEKRAILRTLSADQKTDIWRINFAWGVGYMNLNEIQTEYLIRLSRALPTRDGLADLETEALTLFSKETGFLLFGSIGPYTDVPCQSSLVKIKHNITLPLKRIVAGFCPCSVGSSFNMSCDDDCAEAGTSCTQTEEGCGFVGAWACNGNCSVGGVPVNN